MDSLTLLRPVLVKVKVTENYKKVAVGELQEAIQRIDVDLQRLAFQEKSLTADSERKAHQEMASLKERLLLERQRLEDNRYQLVTRLKEIDALALGTEVVYGKMESPVEVKVGDFWGPLLSTEIILTDGIITEIRR